MSREVYIVDGGRTPFIRAGHKPNPLPAADLAVAAGKQLLMRQPFTAGDLGEVVIGCVGPSPEEANIGRIIALRLGCGDNVPAWTVQRNCASGLQAIDSAAKDIASGKHDLVLAGGTEAMSRSAVLWNEDMVTWLSTLNAAKTLQEKIYAFTQFRPKFLSPVISLLKALTDPVVNLSMGQTAEKLAYMFKISRKEMDEFAVQSHQRVMHGIKEQNYADEIVPLFDWRGNCYKNDNGVREDSNVAKLSTLRAVFDKKFGLVTAGNSSQITDGAALVILASKGAVEKYNLQPLAKIRDISWTALDPAIMGLGPTHSIADLLQRNQLQMSQIDFWEINEAFACQVMACVQALADADYCKEYLNSSAAIGNIDYAKLNIDGGAIALGHPVGATGARLSLHMAHTLRRQNAKLGIASMCIGGGQGGGILLENVAGVN